MDSEFISFNHDKIFKLVFANEKELLSNLISKCINRKINVLAYISSENSSNNEELNLLAKDEYRNIGITLYTCHNKNDRINNLNNFFKLCTQYTETLERYDSIFEFISISLDFSLSLKEPYCKCYDYSKQIGYVSYIKNAYYEVNIPKFTKLWYDGNLNSALKNPLLTMLGINNMEDLKKYSKDVNNSNVKEAIDKVISKNTRKPFIPPVSPEREEILKINTMKKIARNEGYVEVLTNIFGKEAIKEVSDLLKKYIPVEEISNKTGFSKELIEEIRIYNLHNH